MSEKQLRCEPVAPQENLYRAISPEWWVIKGKRISSVAFDWPFFSVDVASLTTPERTLSRFRLGSGLVSFNCGEATEIGFRALHEVDPDYPNNDAHAHVYSDAGRSERKRRSQRLLTSSGLKIICEPVLPSN
jgi:hypothetical protein